MLYVILWKIIHSFTFSEVCYTEKSFKKQHVMQLYFIEQKFVKYNLILESKELNWMFL